MSYRWILLLGMAWSLKVPAQGKLTAPPIRTGAERLGRYLPLLKGKRVALLVNATSRVGNLNLVDTLQRLGVDLVRIFSPEHGFRGNADAGALVSDSRDPVTGIPITSLYGAHTRPSPGELRNVDILIYDIQDVGVRFYTYISSLQRFMEAAALNHKPLILLDRPDPNGFYVDGPVLDSSCRSFVGLQQIPIVYAMTAGEYASMLNQEGWLSGGLHCKLRIIRCRNYTHDSLYQLPVRPSPNLPDMASVYLYPSLCFFEGTPISVGRGTPYPFQLFGSSRFPAQGYRFRPRNRPGATDPPDSGKLCYGYFLGSKSGEPGGKPPGRIRLRWLLQAYRLYPDKDHFFGSYFHLLAGNRQLQQQIQASWSARRIRSSWQAGLARFKAIRKKYLLYP